MAGQPGFQPTANKAPSSAAAAATGRGIEDILLSLRNERLRLEAAATVTPEQAVSAYTRAAQLVHLLLAVAETSPIRSQAQLGRLISTVPDLFRVLKKRSCRAQAQDIPLLLLRFKVFSHTAALVDAMLDAYDRVTSAAAAPPPRRGRQPGRPRGARGAGGGAPFDIHLLFGISEVVIRLIQGLVSTVEFVKRQPPVMTAPGTAAGAASVSASSTAPASAAAASTSLEQLLADVVAAVRPLSRIPAFVQRELWPRSERATAAGRRSTSNRDNDDDDDDDNEDGPVWCGLQLLLSIVKLLRGSLQVAVNLAAARPGGGGGGGGNALSSVGYLDSLVQTRLLASLTAALSAAPLGSTIVIDTVGYRKQDVDVQYCWLVLMRELSDAIPALGAAAAAPLDAPEVRQLQREALRQAAAAAEHFAPAGRQAVVGTCGGSGHGGGGGGGRSTGAGAGAPPQHWLMFQIDTLTTPLKIHVPWQQQMADHMRACVQAAIRPIVQLDRHGHTAAASRLAQRLFPCRTEAAALTAAVSAALHACVDATWSSAVRPGEGGDEGGGEGEGDSASLPAESRRAGAASTVKAAEQDKDHISPQKMAICGLDLARAVALRMAGAMEEEEEACLPDLLEAMAWLAGVGAAAGASELEPGQPTVALPLLSMLSAFVDGEAFLQTKPASMQAAMLLNSGASSWSQLSPETRARCLGRLAPTDLPRSLNALLRAAIVQGDLGPDFQRQQQQPQLAPRQQLERHVAPTTLTPALGELLGPLLCASWERRIVQQQQQQQQQPDSSSSNGGKGVGASEDADNSWRVQEELGLLITALKLLRRDVTSAAAQGHGASALQPPRPQLHQNIPRLNLACFIAQLGLSDQGLPRLLKQMGRAAAGGGAGAVAAVADAEVEVVAQAVAACGCAALPVFEQLLKAALDGLGPGQAGGVAGLVAGRAAEPELETSAAAASSGGGSNSPDGSRASGGVPSGGGGDSVASSGLADLGRGLCNQEPEDVAACVATAAVVTVTAAAKHLPAEVLLPLAPQRLLMLLGRLVRQLMERQQQQQQQQRDAGGWSKLTEHNVEIAIPVCLTGIMRAVVLLSADEQLLQRCVPGWVWAGAVPGTPPGDLPVAKCGLGALVATREGEGGRWEAPRGPVVTFCVGSCPEAALLGSRRWEEHEQHRGQVVALAKSAAVLLGVPEGRAWEVVEQVWGAAAATEAGGDGGTAATEARAAAAIMWPLRRLRLCDNPSCGSFGGKSEESLALKKCARCRAVRYCSADCQLQHWPVHKATCRR
ncbi:SUMO-activating enzyme subunit 1A [Pleodorina starrii]|nr:SUMO-activating enzyme subunit 1A [Pleodorina starrii]